MSDDATIFIGPCQQPHSTGEANISRHLRLIKERETCDSTYPLFGVENRKILCTLCVTKYIPSYIHILYMLVSKTT